MRRTIATVGVALLIGLIAGMAVGQTEFPDVPADHPHKQAIDWSQQVGAFHGYQDGTFKPDRKITAEQATIVFGRVYPDGVSRAEFAALLYAGRDLLADANAAPTTITSTTVAPAEDGYSHAHCARVRNDGGCDRRFRPTYHSCHFHADTYPRHNSGKHYSTMPSDNC